MGAVALVFAGVWVAFLVYWLVASFWMKAGRVPWRRELWIRVVIAVVVLALYKVGALRHTGPRAGTWRDVLGFALLFSGLGLALWARRHIGRNWGPPMTEKNDPHVVVTGPYRLIRHPIYSGLLLAGAGSAIALNLLWLIGVAIALCYFIYAARQEEHYLSARLPSIYPQYKRSTKMLVPFVL